MRPIISVFAAAVAAWSLNAVPAMASTSFPAVAHGNAYAARATLEAGSDDTKLLAGPIAPVDLSCNVRTAMRRNDAESIGFGGALSTGTATDTVASMHGSSSASMQSTSTVQGVNALGGLITATTVEAVANSSGSASGASSNGTGSTFVNLVVAGVPVSGTPAPNTTIALPGIGSVVLNEQKVEGKALKTSITVDMIHIRVTKNNALGLKIGTNIVVAHALSGLDVEASPTGVDADAYGLQVKLHANDIHVGTGRYAPAAISCTAGYDRDRIVSVSSPVGSTGVIVDTAAGTVVSNGGMARGASEIQNTNLLGGIISAGTIRSDAQAQVSSSGSRSGSTTLENAKIAGVRVALHPAPNTRVDIANLGYVILNEQTGFMTGTSAKEEVNAIHLYVTVSNSFNLPVHSSIVIGHSGAEVAAF